MTEPGRTIRAVIVDDEELSRALLKEYLAPFADVEIVAECADGFEAVRAVNDLGPDLLFLDIQMPKLDGFEVLDLIGNDVGVIFVTAYDEHALRAFEVHALDYLVKPFSAERLGRAVGRARAGLEDLKVRSPAMVVADARPAAGPVRRVIVRSGPNVDVVPVDRIDYVLAQDDYVAYVAGGKHYLKQQTLADVEHQLDPARFVRIHRSHILNVDRLARIELTAKDSRAAILQDGTVLPISRSGYSKLKALL